MAERIQLGAERLIALLVSVLLVTSPFGVGGETVSDLFRTHTIIAAVVVLWIVRLGFGPRGAIHGLGVGAGVVLFAAVCLVSYILSPYRYSTQIELVQLGCYLAMGYVLVNTGSARTISLYQHVILGICAVQALLCMWQFLALSGGRPAGTFLNPNLAAGFLLVGFSVALVMLIRETRHWARKTGYGVLLVLMVAAITATGSRSIGLAAAAVIGVAFFLAHRMRTRVFIFALIIIAAVSVVPNPIRQRVVGADQKDIYAFERLRIWGKTLQIITDHPLLGVSLGNFEFSTFRYRFPVNKEVGRFEKVFDDPHSSWLEFLAEMGLAGGLCMALILLQVIRTLRRAYGRLRTESEERSFLCCVLVIAGTAVQAAFHDVAHSPPIVLSALTAWCGIVRLGATPSEEGQDKEIDQKRMAPLMRIPDWGEQGREVVAALAVVLVCVVMWPLFCLTPVLANHYFENAIEQLASNRIPEAASDIDRAILLNPGQPFYFESKAQVLTKQFERTGKTESLTLARNAYETAVALNPMDPSLHYALGDHHYLLARISGGKREMLDAALRHYGSAVDLSPFNVHYRMMLAYLHLTTGDLETAKTHVETCIRHEPVFLAGRHVLKEILEIQGRHSEAAIVEQELQEIKEKYKGYVPRSRYESWLLMGPSVYVEKFLKRA